MLFVSIALGTFGMHTRNEVEHLRYGGEGLVIRIFVLENDEFIGTVDTGPTEGWDCAHFIHPQDDVEAVEQGAVRGIEIDGCNVVSLGGPVD